ncbi:hypothetical protein CHS0354_004141 [Potamilus streckersoni]|uniref:Uncharacterized protein n=1 Tax=Potamilus streckersoni TaxID=2493646 RepID=A0AAE0W589_9BIVA|nr:hypothetical protein CHS0354_004141 [Potamilus streckersoni]
MHCSFIHTDIVFRKAGSPEIFTSEPVANDEKRSLIATGNSEPVANDEKRSLIATGVEHMGILKSSRLERYSQEQQQQKEVSVSEYLSLADQLSEYVVKLLDMVRGQDELKVIIDKADRDSKNETYEHLARLKLAIRYNEKKALDTAHSVSGSTCGVLDTAHSVSGSTCGVLDTAHSVSGSTCGVLNTAHSISDSTCGVLDTAHSVSGITCGVLDTAHSVSGSTCGVLDTAHSVSGSTCGVLDNPHGVLDST